MAPPTVPPSTHRTSNRKGLWTLLACLLGFIQCCHAVSKGCGNHPGGYCVNLATHYCRIGNKLTTSFRCRLNEKCCYPTIKETPVFNYGEDQCGVPSMNANSRIVGGSTTSIIEHPWMASVQRYSNPVCGGSIVGDRWILTAAHCVKGHEPGSVTVVFGTSKARLSMDSYVNRHYVDKIFSHSSYSANSSKSQYDIALIKLSRAINLGTTISRRLCLPDQHQTFDNDVCMATGWGYPQEPEGPATSDGVTAHLMQAIMPVHDKETCMKYMPHHSFNKTLCAGYTSGGEDTCQGDSGGPLVCQGSDGRWYQAGIVSTGRGCARKNALGIYTRVPYFVKWIEYVMKKY